MTQEQLNNAFRSLLGDEKVEDAIFNKRFPEDELCREVAEKFFLGQIEESNDVEMVRRALKKLKEQGYVGYEGV
ncbi:MAG: hypothetical protein UT24_C0015G0022 [Candidatus Woesebacteria bacterium GW2011_GWB1_39_12]|uniref:Uncharacterized protein n=1 Tax=Candidatus Woesebacteria bacterium GW2011_GWB1_39_12 TaxID=1618574 RepID=A0A0G0M7W3_9BACT|nr:MAG: hypothetical protein UT24_C0015G0022 [Candidatus Woesebacteria bacterium GW2011_GWB1_39_12]